MNSSSAQGFTGPWGPVDDRPKQSPGRLPQSLGEPTFASFKVIPDRAALAKTVDGVSLEQGERRHGRERPGMDRGGLGG